jgi:hypothetical protein
VLERNRSIFASRFPELASLLGLDTASGANALLASVPASYTLTGTGTGMPTLSVNGVFLHSRYDPEREAQRTVAAAMPSQAGGRVFAGVGLAYVPELYARSAPDSSIVLVEPDIFVFALCLAARPLDALLAHEKLYIIAGMPAREVCGFLEKTGLDDLSIAENPALEAPSRQWFEEFRSLRKRNKEKREINANTLRRFGDLWLRNMCRNLGEMRDRDGIATMEGIFASIPVLVLAAGPSLDRILPRLRELRQKAVIVAVDTAVRACVRAGVEPDFIVLVDPQYWNWRHLDGQDCPSSILITESATWPAVFRFNCRAIFLCSSLFPLGKFIEARIGQKGELGAGGSVSTTAWDFARYIGARAIFMAGLDLGFPDRKTHFTGSIFEDRTHTASNRLATAETAGYLALYGAAPYPVPDYLGRTVLTDKRLILYAWWFESRLAATSGVRTATITPEGVRIPGFEVASIDGILALPDVRPRIEEILASIANGAGRQSRPEKNEKFDNAVTELVRALGELKDLAVKGIALCEPAAAKSHDQRKIFADLDRLDLKILAHPAKDIVAMLLSDANKAATGEDSLQAPIEDALRASSTLYRKIRDACDRNLAMIGKFR